MTIRPHPTAPDTFILDPDYFTDPTRAPPDLPIDETRELAGWVTDEREQTVTLLYSDAVTVTVTPLYD